MNSMMSRTHEDLVLQYLDVFENISTLPNLHRFARKKRDEVQFVERKLKKPLSWQDASKLAADFKHRLPTSEELRHTRAARDFLRAKRLTSSTWVPVSRADGKRLDWVQIYDRGSIEGVRVDKYESRLNRKAKE